MRKMFLIITILLLVSGCNLNKNTNNSSSLMESNDFKDIIIDEVTKLEIVEYTIDGREESIIDNHDDIVKKYDYLNNFKIGEETNITCEDNTIIYNFEQSDKIISIKIECGNILVTNNNRYELIN